MRYFKLLVPAIAVIATGCVGTAPIKGDPHEVTRARSFQSDGVRGYETIVVRSYQGTRGRKSEIAVRDCLMTGPGYKVKFATPAEISVPNYGRSKPQPRVTCTHGTKTVSKKARRWNQTEMGIVGESIGGTGIFGPTAVAAATAAALVVVVVRPGQESDHYTTANVNLVFKR